MIARLSTRSSTASSSSPITAAVGIVKLVWNPASLKKIKKKKKKKLFSISCISD